MSRSKWKLPFIDKDIYKYMLSNKKNYNKISFSRRSTIYPELVGKEIKVYNGKTFRKLLINEDMVFHKLGEFVSTWKVGNHEHYKK